VGKQALRIDMAEKLLREAHGVRTVAGSNPFALDSARAISMGLTEDSYLHLLRLGGFQPRQPRTLRDGAHGPPAPVSWRWRATHRKAPQHRQQPAAPINGAFAALAELVR
jgi:ATP-dependent RNA helicase SUPV3L1/SUV3